MACPKLSNHDFEITVISVVKTYHPGHTVDMDTNFADDLGEEGMTKRKYFALIRKDIIDDGCRFKANVTDFDNCETVRDMVAATKKATSC
jgi:hypothetical protein